MDRIEFNGTTEEINDARISSNDITNWNSKQSAIDDLSTIRTNASHGATAYGWKGNANGTAELDENGKVPASQLPSYVDDVVEGYYNPNDGKFYTNKSGSTYSGEITGESGKIYIDLDTNLSYRWTGSGYTVISPSLALGETASTAYRGDRGKTAYDHATDQYKLTTSKTENLYKISTTAEGHVGGATAVTKTDITGLGIQETIPDLSTIRSRADEGHTINGYFSNGVLGSEHIPELSYLGALAYKDAVNFSKGDGDFVLGEDTSFTAAASEVSFAGRLTDKVLGKDTSFTVTQPSVSVTPSTKRIKATASGAAVGADGTEDCISDIGNPTTQNVVKTLSVEKTKKLVKTTVPNVTNVGAASNWAFQMGTGADAKTLIISGGNGTAPTLGTAIGVATGEVDAQGTGDAVVTDVAAGSTADAVTGLGTITKKTVLKGVKVTAQPTVTLADNAGAGEGVEVVSGIQSATASGAAVAANNNDEVDAVTNVGTGTAAAQTISVGTNDKVKVAKHGDLGVVVS